MLVFLEIRSPARLPRGADVVWPQNKIYLPPITVLSWSFTFSFRYDSDDSTPERPLPRIPPLRPVLFYALLSLTMQLPSDVYYSPTAESHMDMKLLEEIEPQVVRVMEMKETSAKKEPKPKNHPCEQCLKEGKLCAFSRRPDLTRHISSVHKKDKPFKCSWPRCKSAFSQKASLATHRNTHNKRASDFQNHLYANHNIAKGSINTAEYRWSIDTSLESLEEKPQFKRPGMNGIAMRRSHPPPRARGAVVKAAEPVVAVSDIKRDDTDTPFYDASRSCSSYPTTPALTMHSLSPSPSSQGVDSPQASPYAHCSGNALGMVFGTGEQIPWARPQVISRTSSAASCLGSGSPMLTRPSSAPSVKTECYTPDFSTMLGVDQKLFAPYAVDGSPYMHDPRGQAYYPTPQTFLGPYAHHNGQAMSYRPQLQQYLPGGLGISHTIRSRAHAPAWSSQESFN
uniref:Velvet complex subunit B n=1 Tax=Ganoderma boninense TaxID=34458 RepID=A0A5K1K5F5_9APHY|nr:Velvet complex subunit B [Ganoderma boninense]